MLQITLNKKIMNIESGTTLSQLFDLLALDTRGCAVAIDNQIVPRTQWTLTELKSDVDINLFQAIAGG